MKMISLPTPLSLLFFLACISNVSAQDSIGCFVSGECKGSTYIAIDQVTESVECLRNCKDQVNEGRRKSGFFLQLLVKNVFFLYMLTFNEH